MVGTALILLFLVLLQLTLAAYVRVVAIDCAGMGARYGALSGSSPQAGAERALEALAETLGQGFARSVHAQEVSYGGMEVMEVTLTTRLPVFALLGPGSMTVTGHAVMER